MLVVVIVLGLLMVGLTEGVRAGVALWGAQQRRVGETAELDAGARILRMLLTGISVPPSSALGGPSSDASFTGAADQLKLCRRAADRSWHDPARRHLDRAPQKRSDAVLDAAPARSHAGAAAVARAKPN